MDYLNKLFIIILILYKDSGYEDRLMLTLLSLKLLNQETKELLDNYQNLLQELDDLKKFEKYIDLTQKRQELNEVRKRMSQNENIQKYYQSYYKINELLDEVTKIVFKDISDSLDTSGYKLWEWLQESIKKDN